jgi:hypothetical protein
VTSYGRISCAGTRPRYFVLIIFGKMKRSEGRPRGARIGRAPLFLPLMIPIRRPTDASRLPSRRLRTVYPVIRASPSKFLWHLLRPDPPDYLSLRDGRASAWLVWLLVVTVTGYSGLGSVAASVSS